MRVRASVLTSPNEIKLAERDLRVGPNEVLVKTALAGICGTDKNFYQGRFPKMNGPGYSKDDPLIHLPYYIGHEGGGVVEEVGSHVNRFQKGDFVMSFGMNATMADCFVAPEDELEPAPEGLPEELACLGEPIACAIFSGLHSNVNLGDTAVVYGMGFAGQIISQVLKKRGAHRLIAVDIVDEKLRLAEALGADEVINSSRNDPMNEILHLTEGLGADVVLEIAGVEQSLNQAIASVRHNGTIVLYSWMTQDVKVNISRFHHDSLHVINTGLVHHTVEQRRVWAPWALRPVIQGKIQVDPLINRRFSLDQVKEAFETDSQDPASIKVVLEP